MKLEIPIFDIERERASHSRYEIVTASLDSHPEMYEVVINQKGNEGNFKIYRDMETTSVICIQNSDSGGYNNPDYITLVGDENQMEETERGIRDVIPNYIVLEKILGENKS